MSLDPSGQLNSSARITPTHFYYGTIRPATPGATIALGASAWADAEALLDGGAPPSRPPRSTAVRAASSIQDATATAAIHAYSKAAPVPHDAIHVYRVDLVPLHAGPVALVKELQGRVAAGRGRVECEPLIREYWQPTGTWYVQEILARTLTILEEVPATSERDVYVRRWVEYYRDRERAQSL